MVLLQQGRLVTQGSLQDVIAAASPGGLTIDVAAEQLDAARAILARLNLGDVRVGEGVITTGVAPEDPAIVTRSLAEQGIYLRGLATRRATLEEAFLALTRKAQQP